MYTINVDKKTVFDSGGGFFELYCDLNILFYSDKFLTKGNTLFTVPRGTYYCTKELRKVNTIKNNLLTKNIPVERDLEHDWSQFKFLIGDNPNKCTINHITRTIILDESLLKIPKYVLEFIIQHEKGHNFYNDEQGADIYAVNQMLKKGYTPKQIMLSPDFVLSSKNNKRKLNVMKHIHKIYKNG